MTTFNYRVRDPLGKSIAGSLEAGDLDEASQQLTRQGYQVLELDDDGDGSLFPRSVKKSEIIYMTSQMAIMVDTGINLATALEGIMEQEENPTLKSVLRDLKSRVESGEEYSSALANHPKHFDRTYVALVRASEQTGGLGAMLDRIANYMRNELETRGKVRGALAYPVIMFVLAVCVTLFLLTFIMPKFTPLFVSKGIELPLPTVVMMGISNSLIGYWWAWIAGSVAAVFGFVYGKRTEPGRKAFDYAKINFPLCATMFRKVTLSRGIRTLGTMLKSGVGVLDAIELTAEVSGNVYYEKSWNHVHDQLTQGAQICEALQGNPLFPCTLVQMIGSGEDTGKLDAVLEKVSDYYDREVEMSLKTTTSMIEPLMMVVMGAVVGTIGLSLLLPIFSLSRG